MTEIQQQQCRQLQAVLHEEIPLTQHIGIEVESYDGLSLCLRAPLQNNINHKQTAFGGSLYSVAVLCGWGLLYLKLKERQLHGHIVIHESHAQYALPVRDDIVARTSFASEQELQRFFHMFERKGRARCRLLVDVRQGAESAFQLDGSYVVHV